MCSYGRGEYHLRREILGCRGTWEVWDEGWIWCSIDWIPFHHIVVCSTGISPSLMCFRLAVFDEKTDSQWDSKGRYTHSLVRSVLGETITYGLYFPLNVVISGRPWKFRDLKDRLGQTFLSIFLASGPPSWVSSLPPSWGLLWPPASGHPGSSGAALPAFMPSDALGHFSGPLWWQAPLDALAQCSGLQGNPEDLRPSHGWAQVKHSTILQLLGALRREDAWGAAAF